MDLHRFVNQSVARAYQCNICEQVALKPIKHRNCDLIYCQDCVPDKQRECLQCQKRMRLKDLVPLTMVERRFYGQLEVKCLFCKKQEVLLEKLEEHRKGCKQWPNELCLKGKFTGDTIVSDPRHQQAPIRRFRLVEFFHEGKSIHSHKKQKGYATEGDNISRLYTQAAAIIGRPTTSFSLVHATHEVLKPDAPVFNVLKNTYCSLAIVDKETGNRIKNRRLKTLLEGERTSQKAREETGRTELPRPVSSLTTRRPQAETGIDDSWYDDEW